MQNKQTARMDLGAPKGSGLMVFLSPWILDCTKCHLQALANAARGVMHKCCTKLLPRGHSCNIQERSRGRSLACKEGTLGPGRCAHKRVGITCIAWSYGRNILRLKKKADKLIHR
ncbi:hypothetical protein SETIT_1G285500v2 [Setaria italica]|uniref:Uncharacterized protein n=1 Tax=Setaria italica TaxID=4555 RepID=A0A368PSH5_SETIT|nr:hypothetical protein SETIT_1G285500v2 [Setaria italica]